MVYDISDSLSEDEKRALQLEKDIEWLMSNHSGRRLVRMLLGEAGIWRSTFSPEPHYAAFNEGRRAMGLRIFDLVSDSPNFHLIINGKDDE